MAAHWTAEHWHGSAWASAHWAGAGADPVVPIVIGQSMFDQIFAAAAVPMLMTVNGRSIEYRPAEGPNVTLTAIVGVEQAEEVSGHDGRERRRWREVSITRDAAGTYGGIVEPKISDQVAIDGELYAVQAADLNSSSLARLTVVRIGSMERSRPGYRRTKAGGR